MAERPDGMPVRLTRIDELLLPQIRYLEIGDQCFYWGEYQIHGRFDAGPTNQLITNIKMQPNAQNAHRLKYKNRDIQRAGVALSGVLNAGKGRPVTVVPIPPSKKLGDPEYDDRMIRIANVMVSGTKSNAMELVRQVESYVPSHAAGSGERITPDELQEIYEIVDVGQEPNDTIIVLDDVLTQGAHFCAMKDKLLEHFPGKEILGLFIARAVYNTATEFEAL